jgi:pimeloyl-ACP methyl ester carboxylesterase
MTSRTRFVRAPGVVGALLLVALGIAYTPTIARAVRASFPVSRPAVSMSWSTTAGRTAADDPRVTAVIAAESFSDLRTVASERAPFVFTAGTIARALRLAEQQAQFSVADVSPVRAASAISVPVLLVHGADGLDTPPEHSKRILAALNEPKQLILVPGAHHNPSRRRQQIARELRSVLWSIRFDDGRIAGVRHGC